MAQYASLPILVEPRCMRCVLVELLGGSVLVFINKPQRVETEFSCIESDFVCIEERPDLAVSHV
eukprot:6203231-Pleurochrysis_carterae.AAC.3